MKALPFLRIGLALLACPVGSSAQEAASASVPAPDHAAELEALNQEFREAQQEFYRLFQGAKSDEERMSLYSDAERNPSLRFAPRFAELARRAAGT